MPPTEYVQGGLIPFWMLCDASTVSEKIAFMRRLPSPEHPANQIFVVELKK